MRVAACSPQVRVAQCDYNVEQIKLCIDDAISKKVQLLVLPELSITSVSCGDLFYQESLQHKAVESLYNLVDYIKNKPSIMVAVGMPLRIDSLLFNVAAIISADGIVGFVPKSDVAGSKWFSSIGDLPASVIMLGGKPIAIGNIIVKTPQANIAFEIGSDALLPVSPGAVYSVHGADIICNLLALASEMGAWARSKQMALQHSEHLSAGYVLASAGVGESTTDMVYSGGCALADNGCLLAETEGFSLQSEMIVSDIDVLALRSVKLRRGVFNPKSSLLYNEVDIINVSCSLRDADAKTLVRQINSHPFIPSGPSRDDNFKEIFNIQVHALAKRLRHTGVTKTTIGVSGGLDSTLALLVMVKAYDLLDIPRHNIYGITMPGFGTTGRTYQNAIDLMKELGVSMKKISIKEAVTVHFNDIGHDINKHDLTYENSQARERTQILMDFAGMIGGFVVGTGNMSELALGWATYNGDHMSMYAVNAGVPKTLVQALVAWIAESEYYGLSKKVLLDIVNTPYSPELLPADDDGNIAQKTEHFIGPYELHDFFMHRMLEFGDSPLRILFVAKHAFGDKYEAKEIGEWLRVFVRRFFSQQFKRSCMPDGPSVVSVSLSPRAGHIMPSDAMAEAWLHELDNI